VPPAETVQQHRALASLAAGMPGLCLLVLHGSRATERAHERSDLDLAFEANAAFDEDALLAGIIDAALADRLVRAAGFRNVVAHAYEQLDMTRVYRAAINGPADLRAFFAVIAGRSKRS
jgi:predicted nucleotidyltransferase